MLGMLDINTDLSLGSESDTEVIVSVEELDTADIYTDLNIGQESSIIVELEDLDLLESQISSHQEEIVGLEAKLNIANDIFSKLTDEVENDKLIYDSGKFSLGTESMLSSYEDALFDLDIEQHELESIVGTESATNESETLLVGIEAKNSLLTTISTKIRRFIKAIRRVLKKLYISSMVYLSTVGKDVAKLSDTVDELDVTEGIVLTGIDADTKLKGRVKSILNYYLTEGCSKFTVLTSDGPVKLFSSHIVVKAVELLEANIIYGYNEDKFEDVLSIYSDYIKYKDTDADLRPTTSEQRKTGVIIRSYAGNLGAKEFPSNSAVRKMMKKYASNSILIKSTVRPDKVAFRLLVDYKEKGGKRKWKKVSSEQSFKPNRIELMDISNEELKKIAEITLRVTSSYDLRLLVDASFDLLKDMDDDMAELQASNKGNNKKKLDRLKAMIDFNNSNTSDFIFATVANNKAMYRLLRTLVYHAEDIAKKGE